MLSLTGKMRVPRGFIGLSVAVILGGFWPASGVLADAKVHTITIESVQYAPAVLAMQIGDSVIWENKDMFPHDVSAKAHGLQSPVMAPSSKWQFTPKAAGTYEYRCSFHPNMKATLVVN